MTDQTTPPEEPKVATPQEAAPLPSNPPTMPQPQVMADVIRATASVEELAAWLSNMRNPGIFDTRFPFVILPSSLEIHDIETHMPYPKMTRKKVKFTDSQSFLDYFNRYKVAFQPRLFTKTDSDGMSILCVLDYDEPAVLPPPPAAGQQPSQGRNQQALWNAHQASLSLAYHADYKSLKAVENRWMKQEEFALFVEENTHLFTDPDSATMLELAQDLKGVRNANWQSGKRLANGQVALSYIETVDAKTTRGEVSVPEYLLMTSPIFDGYNAQELRAAFRWKMVDGGHVEFCYRLLTKLAERAALEEVKKGIAELTGLPLYNVSTFDGIIEKRG